MFRTSFTRAMNGAWKYYPFVRVERWNQETNTKSYDKQSSVDNYFYSAIYTARQSNYIKIAFHPPHMFHTLTY